VSEKPALLYFYSPACGRSRRIDSLLAQTLQRNHNHDTFVLRRIDVTKHPEIAARFGVDAKLPVICVVEANRIVGRLVAPHGTPEIKEALGPWLATKRRRGPGVTDHSFGDV
jgi:thioredoxin-like negative regulator of GroEL